MTKEQIQRAYDNGVLGYDDAMDELIAMGMTEKQADDWLVRTED